MVDNRYAYLDTISVPMALFTETGELKHANSAAVRAFGSPAADGMPWDGEGMPDPAQEIEKCGSGEYQEIRHVRIEGEPRKIILKLTCEKDTGLYLMAFLDVAACPDCFPDE